VFDRIQNLRCSLRTQQVNLHKKLHGVPLWTRQPTSLELDTQNRNCSLNCVYCNPQSTYVKKKQGELDLNTVEYLVQLLRKNRIFINYARPWMNSDPLLERRLPDFVKLLKKGLGCRIDIFTNGVATKNKHLLINPLIDDIRFTISASNSDLYTKVHGKPLFEKALETLQFVKSHSYWHQRLWVNFILFDDNASDLKHWKNRFRDFRQDIRCLHVGSGQEQSTKLYSPNKVLEHYRNQFRLRMMKYELPCSCFHNMAISFEGKLMQCCVSPYSQNYGHVEECDVLESYQKRLDIGLNHPACIGCNQKNPEWRELFEKYVWT
jgi:pyruvate-formate lyase-activating enzyme